MLGFFDFAAGFAVVADDVAVDAAESPVDEVFDSEDAAGAAVELGSLLAVVFESSFLDSDGEL